MRPKLDDRISSGLVRVRVGSPVFSVRPIPEGLRQFRRWRVSVVQGSVDAGRHLNNNGVDEYKKRFNVDYERRFNNRRYFDNSNRRPFNNNDKQFFIIWDSLYFLYRTNFVNKMK